MYTNTDMTLYSRSTEAGAEAWSRTVIEEVLWEERKAANVIRSGLIDADKVAIYVPINGRTVSIKPGDVIVEGIVTKTISTEYTITDLRKDYSDTATVRTVDRMDYGSAHMHHLRIGAA